MKTYCDPHVQKDFLELAKPVDQLYEVSIDERDVRFIKVGHPTEIVKSAFDNVRKEIEVTEGDYQGTTTVVYRVIDGPGKDHYMFYTYNYGSCEMCDLYSGILGDMYFLSDDKFGEAVITCEKFIRYILRSVKLVEKDRLREFLLDNFAFHWKYENSEMLKLMTHFGFDVHVENNDDIW